MKKFTIISGKGGTGKTTFIANIAALTDNAVLADCDVDAPNLHLLLKPSIKDKKPYSGSQLAKVDTKKCIECGKCLEVCNFGAITNDFKIIPLKCDGCKVCVEFCPAGAIKMKKEVTGEVFISDSKYGPMIHARLKAGADNSGKLVSEVRKISEEIAEANNKDLILIDGSPGIGCPVIASLNGVDGALVVTEPTKSGLSDLKRVLEVCAHFDINAMVVINKFDINQKMAYNIENYCQEMSINVIGRIPFDEIVNRYLRKGQLLIKDPDNEVTKSIKNIWKKILKEEMVLNEDNCSTQ